MIRKYCKGIPLYVALISAALFLHAVAMHWDANEDGNPQPVRALARHT